MMSPSDEGFTIRMCILREWLGRGASGGHSTDFLERLPELGIEWEFVVHFELEVDAKGSGSARDVAQEFIEGQGEVGQLAADDAELQATGPAMFFGVVGALHFLGHMEFLERKD